MLPAEGRAEWVFIDVLYAVNVRIESSGGARLEGRGHVRAPVWLSIRAY